MSDPRLSREETFIYKAPIGEVRDRNVLPEFRSLCIQIRMANNSPTSSNAQPSLKRALGLSALIFYGIILIQPTAPVPLFGAAAVQGKGHVITAILIGMVAMLFTAISYGRMANAYPSAGSAYSYVSREIHPALGYFAGWSIIFDYVMIPISCVIWASMAAKNIVPEVPFAVFAVIFAFLLTGLNLRGIEASSRTNVIIVMGLGVIIVLFLGASVHYLWRQPPDNFAGWMRPFYDPQTFSWPTVSRGAALAELTYNGFDGISTLSEEAHNPRRNILLATVLVCLITGVLASIQVYAAQLVWPGTDFPDVDTAFCYVAGKAGGHWLFQTINFAVLIATLGSGAGAHLGAGRLLYSMGRDNAIPQQFFGVVNPRTRIPSNNIIFVGVLMLIGAFAMNYAMCCELINFGALFAFMGVNASAFMHYYLRSKRKSIWDLLSPLIGFTVCAYLWWSLGRMAHVIGSIWLLTGILYGTWRTSFFRKPIQFAKLDSDSD